jgi:hypothetical protein
MLLLLPPLLPLLCFGFRHVSVQTSFFYQRFSL